MLFMVFSAAVRGRDLLLRSGNGGNKRKRKSQPAWLEQLEMNAYQSALFNLCVAERIKRGLFDTAVEKLNLSKLLDREIGQLSGGELQRFIIAVTCVQNAQVYMFDEPTSFLDIEQRMKASEMIRSLSTNENFVICVEHDISILDYLSDRVCCMYGYPSVYGVVTIPMSVRQGINVFLSGYIPTENLRFREDELEFLPPQETEQKSLMATED